MAIGFTPFSTEFRVNSCTSGSQEAPSVTGLKDGGYVVTWQGPGKGDSTGAFAQRYDAEGTKVGVEFRVNGERADMAARVAPVV